tara:strand:- start:1656 stop:2489 length:834 start_codon:yes stop_codon:yes gene_type:complete
MITYKEYKMLMETVTPTVNLGVTTPDAVGGVGNSFGFTAVDATDEAEDLLASLAETKKKMFGDEMVDPKDAPPKDSDDDAEKDAEEDSDDDGDDDDKECMKKSKKEEIEAEALLSEKKCGKKCGKKMCGDMDGGDEEDADDDGEDGDKEDADADVDPEMALGDDEMAMMKKKSKKEEDEFFNSLATQLQGDTSKSHKDGISEYLEDAVFTPHNSNSALGTEPGPGEVGFAPEGRIGAVGSYEVGSEEQQSLSTNFMDDWQTIKDLALGVRENGLQDG